MSGLERSPSSWIVRPLRKKSDDDFSETDPANGCEKAAKILATLRGEIATFGLHVGAARNTTPVIDRNAQPSLPVAEHGFELPVDFRRGGIVIRNNAVRVANAVWVKPVPGVIGTAAMLSG